jgi:hypothetical protein
MKGGEIYMADNILEEFTKNDKFLNFNEDGVLEEVFQSVIKEKDPFGKVGEERLSFTFLCSDGKERQFTSKSKRLAKEMLKVSPQQGETLQITRFGEGFETMYKVKKIASTDASSTDTAKEETSQQEISSEDVPF